MLNETTGPAEISSARTNHSLNHILFAKEFGTTIEVYRDDEDGQLKITACYNSANGSPSDNSISIKSIPFKDILEIMRIAVEFMTAEGCESAIMELRKNRRTLFFI